MAKPKENIINVTEVNTPGTKDNDIFQISDATPNNAVISPQYATDTLKFMDKLYSVSAELSGKDLVITYEYKVSETSYIKTLTIKDYFTSEKGMATKSSLKNLIYTDAFDSTERELSVSTEVPIERPLIMFQKKSNKIIGTNFADVINLTKYVSDFHAVSGGKGNDEITGSNTADTISGDAGDDYIIGMGGSDTITGGKGNNTYAYDQTDNGYDVINLTKGETANILYEDYTDNASFTLDGDGNGIIVFDTEKPARGAVLLKGFAKKDITREANFLTYPPNSDPVSLKTGVTWEYTAADDYKGSYINEHIDATGIETAKKNKKGKEIAYTFNGGKGDDTIEASYFADKITGGAGKNTYLYQDVDQLDGDKIYLTKGENALIELGTLTATGYEVVGKDLVVTVTDGAEEGSFTIVNFGTKDITNNKTKKLEDTSYVLLNDSTSDDEGSIDLRSEIQVKSDKGTFHDDYIDKSSSKKGVTVKGGAGDDTIIGSDYKDTLKAGTGDFESITGGKGNDKLYASTTEHSETKFYFNAGDGNDTVYSGNGVVKEEDTGDTLVFNNLSFGDIEFKKSKNDLVIKYTDKDSVTIKNYYKKTSVLNISALEGTLSIEELMNPDKVKHVSGEAIVTEDDLTIIGSDDADTITVNGRDNRIITKDGDDIIYSGTVTNTINAGTGNNIIHNRKNATDWIVNGGGADTIVLDGVTDINTILFDVDNDGKDLYIDKGDEATVRFENYMITEDHSAKYLQVGGNTVSIKDFRNDMSGKKGDDTITATDWQDDIYTTKSNAKVYANGGNDIIHIDNNSNYPNVYVGKGDDIVSLEATGTKKPNVDIFFNNGDGNNTLKGLGLRSSFPEGTEINLRSNGLLNNIDYHTTIYVEGERDGSDLLLKLSSGETFRIEDYYLLSADAKNMINLTSSTSFLHSFKIPAVLVTDLSEDADLEYLDDVTEYTESGSDKLIIAEDVETARTFDLDGDNNQLLAKGKANQIITVSGDNSTVYAYNTGSSLATDDIRTTININSENNKIYAGGGYSTSVNIAKDVEDNYVEIADGRTSVYTAQDGSTTVVASGGTINSKGADTMDLTSGDFTVNLQGKYDKTITMYEKADKVDITNAGTVKSLNMTQTFWNNNVDVEKLMFNRSDDGKKLSLYYCDEDYEILNNTVNRPTISGTLDEGGNLDLDAIADKITMTVKNDNGTLTNKLSEMTQLVRMSSANYNPEYSSAFEHEIFFDEQAQSKLLTNKGGTYIKGTDKDDNYSGYSFTDSQYAGTGKLTINDAGSVDGDELYLAMNTSDCNFFIDFYDNGNVVASSDLIIFNDTDKSVSDGLYNYLGYGGHEGELDYISEYVQIKNGFSGNSYSGAGAIETISANKEDDDDEFKFNVNSYVNDIKSNIASWMWDYNHEHVGLDCNTVSEALSYGLSDSERDSLYAIYNNGAANQWSKISS